MVTESQTGLLKTGYEPLNGGYGIDISVLQFEQDLLKGGFPGLNIQLGRNEQLLRESHGISSLILLIRKGAVYARSLKVQLLVADHKRPEVELTFTTRPNSSNRINFWPSLAFSGLYSRDAGTIEPQSGYLRVPTRSGTAALSFDKQGKVTNFWQEDAPAVMDQVAFLPVVKLLSENPDLRVDQLASAQTFLNGTWTTEMLVFK